MLHNHFISTLTKNDQVPTNINHGQQCASLTELKNLIVQENSLVFYLLSANFFQFVFQHLIQQDLSVSSCFTVGYM